MTKEEAIKIYKKHFPKTREINLRETRSYFIFFDDGSSLKDPVMVRKSNGECRGYIPPIDGE